MPAPKTDPITVADTAKWVAMYRALESERSDALFHDPYARRLAGARGEEILRRVPRGKMYSWPMVVRTVVVDEIITQAVAHRGIDLVINLATGLDARPYRMDLPPSLQWVEIDYPQTIEEKKKALAADSPRCKLVRIGADLADPRARRAAFAQADALGTRGLAIAEGLMIYLEPEQAGQLAQDLADLQHLRLWVTDIAAPFIMKMMSRMWRRALGSVRFKFAPEQGAGFYEPFGWHLEQYRSAWREAGRYRRESPMAWIWKALYPRMWRQENNRRAGPMTGVILLSRER